MRKIVDSFWSVFSWFLIAGSIFWLLFVFLLLLEKVTTTKGNNSSAMLGSMMFSVMCAVPGIIIRLRIISKRKEEKFWDELEGLLRTYNSFTISEISQKIGKNELETTSFIQQLVADDKIDLMYHRKTQEYYQRAFIKTDYRKVDSCKSCGANFPPEFAVENEYLACSYCGSSL